MFALSDHKNVTRKGVYKEMGSEIEMKDTIRRGNECSRRENRLTKGGEGGKER